MSKCFACGKELYTVSKEETVTRYYCRNPACEEVGDIIVLKPVGLIQDGRWVQLGKLR